jgi:hypothetical protein
MFDQQHEAAAESHDQPIWRFLEFAQFVDLLDRKSLFFARTDTLEDPFAGLSDDAAFATRTLPEELMRMAEQSVAPPAGGGRLERWWSRKTQENRQDALINTIRNFRPAAVAWASCWHAAGPEQMVLWKSYRSSGKQLAIRTTIGKLRAALAAGQDLSISVGFVRYVDAAALAGLSEPVEKALAKNRTLAYEREVRAVLTRAACAGADCLGRGVSVAVDVGRLIDDVIVSPAAEDWLRDLVRRVLCTYGFASLAAISGEGQLALPDYTPERALPSS